MRQHVIPVKSSISIIKRTFNSTGSFIRMGTFSFYRIFMIFQNHSHCRSHTSRHTTLLLIKRTGIIVRCILIPAYTLQQRRYRCRKTCFSKQFRFSNRFFGVTQLSISGIIQFQPPKYIYRQAFSYETSIVRIAQYRLHTVITGYYNISRLRIVINIKGCSFHTTGRCRF